MKQFASVPDSETVETVDVSLPRLSLNGHLIKAQNLPRYLS